jgi:uracil-DNA glycosylase
MDLDNSIKLKKIKNDLIINAKKHELYKNVLDTKGNIVFGRGSDSAKILFIGEAPGFNENAQGKPFVGRSGKLLEKWIKELNLSEKDYAIMNVVPIIPLSKDKKIRPPTEEEINYFLPQTKKMIENISPKIIVLLGRSSASIFDKKLIVGQAKKEVIGNLTTLLYFIYHPAYYLRNGKNGFEGLSPLKKILKENKKL